MGKVLIMTGQSIHNGQVAYAGGWSHSNKFSNVTFVISKLRQNLARFKKIELFYV